MSLFFYTRQADLLLVDRWLSNFSLLLINRYLLVLVLPLSLLELLYYSMSHLGLQTPLSTTFDKNGFSIAYFLLYLCCYDLLAYWIHRLLHSVGMFWRFHRVHHSDKALDVSTSVRHHPIEPWVVGYLSSLILLLLKCPIEWLGVYILLTHSFALFVHANVKIPARLDDWLSFIFITPSLHSVHHSQYQVETDSNYGNIFSIWDRSFGSYRKNRTVVNFGLDNEQDRRDQSLFQLLKNPFRHQ